MSISCCNFIRTNEEKRLLTLKDRTDGDLMDASCNGDAGAFGQLFERYHARLLNYAVMLSSGKADSEAVVQDALMRAYTARNKYRGEASVSTWLFTITRNEVYRGLKRKNSTPICFGTAVFSENPEEIVLRNERVNMVINAMRGLPRLQKEAIVLTRHGGLNCAEAAQVLGTTESNIQNAVFRGLKSLRKLLVENG